MSGEWLDSLKAELGLLATSERMFQPASTAVCELRLARRSPCAQYMSGELLKRVADALVSGRITAPPITRITLEQTPAALNPA